MSNKNLGRCTLVSYGLALVLLMAGSYTDELTPWDMLSTVAAIVGWGFAMWGAVRLARM